MQGIWRASVGTEAGRPLAVNELGELAPVDVEVVSDDSNWRRSA